MYPCVYEYFKLYFFAAEQWTVFLMSRKMVREGKLMNICKWLVLVTAHKSEWVFSQLKKNNMSIWKKGLLVRCEVQKEKILQKK